MSSPDGRACRDRPLVEPAETRPAVEPGRDLSGGRACRDLYGRDMAHSLVVKVTAGADDPERCNQGFTVAATAVTAGADVSLWLTGDAAWLGVPGRAEAFALPHAQPLADLLA